MLSFVLYLNLENKTIAPLHHQLSWVHQRKVAHKGLPHVSSISLHVVCKKKNLELL